MKSKKNILLYDFDFKYEYRTYKNVGLDYIPKGIVYKIRNFLNKKEKRYKKCNTYKEWKEYISNKTSSNYVNNENMIYFLNRKKSRYDRLLEIIQTIQAPLLISMYSMGYTIFNQEGDSMGKIEPYLTILFSTILAVIILIILYTIYTNCKNKVFFYNDYIEVLKILNSLEEMKKL